MQTIATHSKLPRHKLDIGHEALSLDEPVAAGPVRVVKTREHIFMAGDKRTSLFKIESGCVCLYKIMADGRRQVLDFAYAGDFIGLGSQSEHSFNAQALEPTRLKSLTVATLTQLAARDPRLGLKLYEALSRELEAAQDHLFTVGQRTAVERVASFLSALSRRNARTGQDASVLVLPMTRADIADFLGLTIETVSRTFTRLRSSKVIALEQSTVLRLVNTEKLNQLALGEVEA